MKVFDIFIEKMINDTPEYMTLFDNSEIYINFDRFILSINEKAMPWLFKVYMEQNFNILNNEELSKSFKKKYFKYRVRLIQRKGIMFLNKECMIAILTELLELNQITINKKNIIELI